MSKSWPYKDPNEVLDYGINWAPRVAAGDTIIAVVHTVVSGDVVIDDETFSSSGTVHTTTVWLSGGTLASSAEILCRVTTDDGRTMDQTVRLKIKAK